MISSINSIEVNTLNQVIVRLKVPGVLYFHCPVKGRFTRLIETCEMYIPVTLFQIESFDTLSLPF